MPIEDFSRGALEHCLLNPAKTKTVALKFDSLLRVAVRVEDIPLGYVCPIFSEKVWKGKELLDESGIELHPEDSEDSYIPLNQFKNEYINKIIDQVVKSDGYLGLGVTAEKIKENAPPHKHVLLALAHGQGNQEFCQD